MMHIKLTPYACYRCGIAADGSEPLGHNAASPFMRDLWSRSSAEANAVTNAFFRSTDCVVAGSFVKEVEDVYEREFTRILAHELTPALCPECAMQIHTEYACSWLTDLPGGWLSEPRLLWNGPMAAACVWITEEVEEMEDACFRRDAAGTADALFDMLGIIVNALLAMKIDGSDELLELAHDSYVWAQIRRGRSVSVPHHRLIKTMVRAIRDCHFVEPLPGVGSDLLVGAMSKDKRRTMILSFLSRYKAFLASFDR